MPTEHEQFWTQSSYAFVGHSAKSSFPHLSYGEAKRRGMRIFPVDPSLTSVDGDKAYPEISSLPEKVSAALLEVPKDEMRSWVQRAADAGVASVWMHMGRDTPEALALAKEKGIKVLTGTCAVMYLMQGPSYHSIHKWIMKARGKY
jgi:O-acetylhomoserine (thiol)-lyase